MPRYRIKDNAPKNAPYDPGDVVDVPKGNTGAWQGRTWAERIKSPPRRQAEVERAVVTHDAAERAVELDPWPLRQEPSEYLERYPEGRYADLARRHMGAS